MSSNCRIVFGSCTERIASGHLAFPDVALGLSRLIPVQEAELPKQNQQH